MKVSGASTTTSMPSIFVLAALPLSLRSSFRGRAWRRFNSSTNQNPALCRVLSYFGPGLPRPTISQGLIAGDSGPLVVLVDLVVGRILLAARSLAGGAAFAQALAFLAFDFLGNFFLAKLRLCAFGQRGIGFGGKFARTLTFADEDRVDQCRVVVFAVFEDRNRDTLGQHEFAQHHPLSGLQVGQVDFEVFGQVLRQRRDFDFGHQIGNHHPALPAGRTDVLIDEMQRNRDAEFVIFTDALEVDVHDGGFERMALQIAQDDLLLASVIYFQFQNGCVKRFLVRGMQDEIVLEGQGDRIARFTVNNCRHFFLAAQAAARTFPYVFAQFGRHFVSRVAHVEVSVFGFKKSGGPRPDPGVARYYKMKMPARGGHFRRRAEAARVLLPIYGVVNVVTCTALPEASLSPISSGR